MASIPSPTLSPLELSRRPSINSTSSDEKVSSVTDASRRAKAMEQQRASGILQPMSFERLDASIAENIVAKGPEAEALSRQYRETLARHSRLNPRNSPSPWMRAVLLLFCFALFWYAIEGRKKVVEWRRYLNSLTAEIWDKDYTNMDQLMPMAEANYRPVGHFEL